MSCIGWYILAIVAFPTILMLVDAYIGYKKGGSELRGISGFRRATIALTVILILGIAVFHILANDADTDADPNSRAVVSNILSMLAGLVAGISGFYFGGRFTEKRAEEAEKRAEKAEKELKKWKIEERG